MNNKGFTLVELLAVIVILVGISLTTVMGISASLERRDVKECEEQVEIAKNAAKIYFSLLDKITVGELVDKGYFNRSEVNKLKDNDAITVDGRYIGSCLDGCDEQIAIVKNAAKKYFSSVTVEALIKDDYFDENKVDRLNDGDTITNDGGFNGTKCQKVKE